jgi:ABC-type Na+ efflux pump permease subunit
MASRIKEAGGKLLGVIFGLAVVVGLIALGMNTQKNRETKYPWKGAVYALTNDVKDVRDSSDFKTLDACRTWSTKQLADLGLNRTTGGFSCGTDCTWRENTITGGHQVKLYDCTEVITE